MTERGGALLFSSLIILCTLGMSSCTGTGGSANSMGAVYNPDGSAAGSSGGSSGNGGSVSGSSSGSSSTTGSSDSAPAAISADDLHRLANGGLADSITAYFPAGEDETSKTFYLNLSAEDFGVPEDGYMVLAIDSDGFANGGTHWDDTQYISDVDGCAHFMNIPMMQVRSHVTVTLLCYTAGGVLISSGYCSGTVNDDMGIPMEIAILGPPAIVLGTNGAANGSDIVHDGARYDIIEYTGASLSMTAVNTNSDSTMEVTVNDTPVSGTNASVSAVLADGFNSIVSTVRKGDNAPVVITRNIYVVKKLVQPVIELGANRASYGRTVSSGGKTYDVIEYTTDAAVTSLGMTVTNGYTGDNAATGSAVFEVTVNGSPVSGSSTSVSTTLADGLNAIVATVTKEHCTPVREERYLYVVKALSEDDIEIDYTNGTKNHKDGGTFGEDAAGYEYVKYSYFDYDKLKLAVTNNYTGDNAATGSSTMTVTVTGATSISNTGNLPATELEDGRQTITVKLTKPHCEPVELEEKINAHIKKVRVKLSSGSIDIWGSEDEHVHGSVALWADGEDWHQVRSWNDSDFSDPSFDISGDVWHYLSEKTSKLHYESYDLMNDSTRDTPFADVRRDFSLKDLKDGSYSISIPSDQYRKSTSFSNDHVTHNLGFGNRENAE